MSTETMAVEQAAEAIGAVEETEVIEQDAPEFAEDAPEEEQAEAEETAEEAEESEEETEEPEDKPEPIPVPNSWSKEDAKAWDALTPEAQAIVARREKEVHNYIRETGSKAQQARVQVENEARAILAQQAEQHAQALNAYAQLVMPAEPDPRLLYTGDQNDMLTYQRQDAAYRAGLHQQQQLQQAIAQSQQQADAARQQALSAETQVDAQRLAEQLPEWFDDTAGPKLRAELQSIGADLGYPVELMAEASSTDILALKKAAEWKAKADQFDKLNKDKMAAVRAAKALPKMGQPGTTQTKGQQSRAGAAKVSDAIAQFNRDRSPEAAAALLGSRSR